MDTNRADHLHRRVDPEPITAVLVALAAVGDAIAVAELLSRAREWRRGRDPGRRGRPRDIQRDLTRLEDELREVQVAIDMLLEVVDDPSVDAHGETLDFGRPLLLPDAEADRYFRAVAKLHKQLPGIGRVVRDIERAMPPGMAPALDEGAGRIRMGIDEARGELRALLRSEGLVVPEALRRAREVVEGARAIVGEIRSLYRQSGE